MRGRNIGQRIDRPHMRPQPALRHQCAQLIELAAILPGEHEVIGRVLAPGLDQVLCGCAMSTIDTTRPSCASASGLRDKASPPMVSNTTSTPRPSVARNTASI